MSKYLAVYTTDMLKAGDYDFRLTVAYVNDATVFATTDFRVSIVDYCVPTLITVTSFSVSPLVYYNGDPDVVSTFTSWTPVPSVCNLSYQMTVSPTLSNPSMIIFDNSALTVTI